MMEQYQRWFNAYWKLRAYRKVVRSSNLPTKEKFAKMLPVMRAMRKLRHKIEEEMFLFPKQSSYVPGE